jgi:outer membrane receptor protein involved in Fe transport
MRRAWCNGRLLVLAWLAVLVARATPVRFDIPPQPAHTALLAFAKQSRLDVLFPLEELKRKKSPGVIGDYEPEVALARILEGTGYAAQQGAKGKFVIAPVVAQAGGIRGRLVTPDSRPADGLTVTIAGTRRKAATNAAGEFAFPELPPKTYTLSCTGPGFQPVVIRDVAVAAGQLVSVGTYTIEKEIDPARMAPFVVESTSERRSAYDRERADFSPRSAIGNLDLKRTENGALPYTVYDRNQIVRSGVVNLNEFLQRELLDGDAAARTPDQNGLADPFVAGSSNLRLRGYDSDETVILVNGRRLPEVITTGQKDFLPPDVNFIPLSLVQQVEVLPVSASALYTGNPVGGIINIVLRPGADVNATEVTTTYTNALGRFDAPESSLSLLHTRNLLGGALRLRFNATFSRATPATEAELGYHQGRAPPPASLEAAIFRATPNVRSVNLSPLFGPGSAPVTSVAPGADGTGGLAAFAGREGMPSLDFFKSRGGNAASLDSIDYPYGRRQQRSVYFGSAVYDVTPWLQLGAEGAFGHSVTNRGYDVFATDLFLAANSPLNPFRRAVSVSLNETAPQLGENYSEARLEFSSLALGAIVKAPGQWRVALDGQFARNVSKYRGLGGLAAFDAGRWQQLVDRGVYNPLRDTQKFAPPQAFYDEVLIYRGGRNRFITLGDYDTLDGAIRATNETLRLPTGTSTVNVGLDYRRNHLAPFVDEPLYGDGTPAADPVRWAGRKIERYSAFGELQTPILPARWLPSWVRTAEADVAVRYVASSAANEANVAPTYSLKLELASGLTLRGSITTSSRFPTPNMSRLYVDAGLAAAAGPPEPTLINDPLRRQNYNAVVIEALNPNLRPEEALTQTAGIVYRHGEVHRFRAALDFVDTHKLNELVGLTQAAVLGNESLWPERVVRAPVAAGDFHQAGLVTTVFTGATNLAWRHSQNWNGSLHYAWTRCLGGTLEVHSRLLYFSRYQRRVDAASGIKDELSDPTGTAPGLLRYRANFGANWSNKNYGLGLDGHYFHSRVLPVSERSVQPGGEIAPFWQFDAFAQAELGRWLPKKILPGGLRLQARVNNVFDRAFPVYVNGPSASGVQPYGDWRGRVYSLSLTAAF